ncbi:RodZ domain-containing protein [Marinobacterium aestuariivivens]|uniref:RodZ domain-containing protein n=1 Tax=Marinobacterium aestuariivivens TaxID=1698799 RepID=A0ABW2A2G7_9GAMM
MVGARERLGLSAQQVAAELRLPLEQVEALERADFARLPSVVFTRGYIRAYARLVKLDGDELVRQFDRCYGGESQPASIRTVSRVRPSGSSGPATFGSMLLLVLVIVGATFWWWKTQYGHEVAVEDLPEPAVAVETADGETLVFTTPDVPLEGEEESMVPQDEALAWTAGDSLAEGEVESDVPASGAQPLLDGIVPALGVAGEELAAAESREPVPAEAELAVEPVAVSEGLYLRFSDDCWVTIKNADGKTLYNNLRKAGQELRLEEGGSMNVLLGRASAVSEFTFDGNAVDLAPFSNKNVARLTLPVSQ